MNTDMITSIPIRITGESWYNAEEFLTELQKLDSSHYVLIDLNSEGPSLSPFGIYGILAQHPHNYIFTKWSNPIEKHPHGRVACSQVSHFFKLSWRYWVDLMPNDLAEKTFGLFLGRNSIARNCILYDVYHTWQEKFLLSKMSTSNAADVWEDRVPASVIKAENIKSWLLPAKELQVREWWTNCPVTSIDNKSVRDQYGVPEINSASCALSLLSHYNKFNFELVCETYTIGTTFFPTEKTIRPIVGNKPFLVYGPTNYLKNLQNLGFKTFSSIWNEQYDRYEGADRWKSMQPIIDMICKWDDETKQSVLKQCSAITQHNRNRLKEMLDDNQRI